MWTPGLLFLLLMSSCLPVSTAPPDTESETSDEEQLKQGLHGSLDKSVSNIKKLNGWFKKSHKVVGEILLPYIQKVPVIGEHLAAVIKILQLLVPEPDVVNSQLKGLNVKLDSLRAEMKWDAWAAGAYLIPVNNIEKAWIKYTELVCHQTTNTEKEELKKRFFTFYNQYADSTLVLHQFLTVKPGSITENLGDLLVDRLRCHENDVKAQFLFLNKLMFKGNMLDEKYHEFQGTNTDARVKAARDAASQSASALMALHQRCLSNNAAYVERDIFELIDDTKKHREIEAIVGAFLDKTYDSYNWMVVAFTTPDAKLDIPFLHRHTVRGFTKVKRGSVTVAVAKQVKGGHTKTADVIAAINKCIPQRLWDLTSCLKVAEKLMKCQETVFGKPLSQTYTAVHSVKFKRHTSTSAVEEPDDENSEMPKGSSLTPHVFVQECGKLGRFQVLIKSDQELKSKKDLCPKGKCGQNGKCVVVPGTFIEMCECQYPYFGESCEMSLEEILPQEPECRTLNPERIRYSKSVPPSAGRRPRKSTSQKASNRKSRKRTLLRRSNRKSRKRTLLRRSNRKSRKRTLLRRSNRKSRKRTLLRRSNRKSRKRTLLRRSNRKSRRTLRRRSNRKSRKRTLLRRSNRKSRKRTLLRRSNRKSRKRTLLRRSNRKSRKRTLLRRSNRKSRKRTLLRRSNRKSRKRTLPRRSNRKSRKSTSLSPSKRRSQSNSQQGDIESIGADVSSSVSQHVGSASQHVGSASQFVG